MMLLTLRGTPTTYYGEELGMENGRIPPEFIQDPPAVNQPEIADVIGRDPVRTPMQWDSSPHAGFTEEEVTSWLPVAENYQTLNAAAQEGDPTSMLSLYRSLTALRQQEPALFGGAYERIDLGEEDIFAYRRFGIGSDDFLIVLNFGEQVHLLDLSSQAKTASIEVSTSMSSAGQINLRVLIVAPNEGLVLRI